LGWRQIRARLTSALYSPESGRVDAGRTVAPSQSWGETSSKRVVGPASAPVQGVAVPTLVLLQVVSSNCLSVQ
jgi:hypothetical protein